MLLLLLIPLCDRMQLEVKKTTTILWYCGICVNTRLNCIWCARSPIRLIYIQCSGCSCQINENSVQFLMNVLHLNFSE